MLWSSYSAAATTTAVPKRTPTALVGKQRVRYDATLRLLAAI